MSIKLMTLVWDGLPASGSELLIMLALADWCDDRGGSLYPSVKAVGDKARVGEKHARNILHKFEKRGYLAVVGNRFGGKPGTTREYRLNVGKLKMLADAANVKKEADKASKYGINNSANDQWEDVFATAPLEVTPPPQVTRTAPPQFLDGSPVVTKTAPLEVTLTTIEPSIEPSIDKTCLEVLNHLNAKTKRIFKPVKVNLDFIRARLKEGFTKDDLIKVIDVKCSQWLKDEKMNNFLRPATLFNATNCAQYSAEEIELPKERKFSL